MRLASSRARGVSCSTALQEDKDRMLLKSLGAETGVEGCGETV